jgi:hypothetical protein
LNSPEAQHKTELLELIGFVNYAASVKPPSIPIKILPENSKINTSSSKRRLKKLSKKIRLMASKEQNKLF